MSATSRSDGPGGYIGAAGDVLLEHVVLNGPGERAGRHALLLRDELVEQEQQRGGRIDGHRGGDLVHRDAVKQRPHVLDGIDGHAYLADLPVRHGRVGVVAHLGGQVEGNREARGAGRYQLVVALVGLSRGGEARVLAHGPRPARVHGRVDAAGERELTGLAEFPRRIESRRLPRAVYRLDWQPGLRLASHEPRISALGLRLPVRSLTRPTASAPVRRRSMAGPRTTTSAKVGRQSIGQIAAGRLPRHRTGTDCPP